jgi:hypothetical protein
MPAGNTYEAIATTTVSGSSTSSVIFNSFSGYTDLRVIFQGTSTTGTPNIFIQFNSDTASNYSYTLLSGNGSSATSTRSATTTGGLVNYFGLTTSTIQQDLIDIMNYSNSTTNKTIISRFAEPASGTGAIVSLWRNTSAITSINLYTVGGGNFAAGSTFSLYGITAA